LTPPRSTSSRGCTGAPAFNAIRLAGKRRLAPGAYRLTVLATDATGNVAAEKRARFRLAPRR
jgi:hypothetical protein